MGLNQKIEELFSTCQKADVFPNNIRFFVMQKDRYMRFHNGVFSINSYREEFGFITRLSLNRGEIIDTFAKLEWFTNELIHLHFWGISFQHTLTLDDILECVDFERRLRLLKQWNAITGSLLEKITHLTKVRNQLAHIWDVNGALYKKQKLSQQETFQKFQEDFKNVFNQLIEIYRQKQECVDFEKYIDDLIQNIEESNRIYQEHIQRHVSQKSYLPVCPYCQTTQEHPGFPLPSFLVCKQCKNSFVGVVTNEIDSEMNFKTYWLSEQDRNTIFEKKSKE